MKFFAAVALWTMLAVSCHAQELKAVYTSTREVTAIAADGDGRVWAATTGGVLERDAKGQWRKYTMLDGHPDNEVLGVTCSSGVATARCRRGWAMLMNGRWEPLTIAPEASPLVQGQISRVRWNGRDCVATPSGLTMSSGGNSKPVPIPGTRGSFITCLLDRGKALWAGVFGDGVYSWDGKTWSRIKPAVPEEARWVTALAADRSHVWIGTAAHGVWELEGGKWKQRVQPGEPVDHNCQAMAKFGNLLYVSTIDRGFAVKFGQSWRVVSTPELSTGSPRQGVEFKGSLYVRLGNGVVDRFDGALWTRNVFKDLPRKQCSAIAADAERLYAGQWGGWSEFDGKTWTHRLDIPELQGSQVTAILPEAVTFWVGTQGKGIAAVDRSTGKVVWHDERAGLTDDTIKCLTRSGKNLWCGTFAGGAAFLGDGASKWQPVPEVAKSQVTDIQPDGSGGAYIGSRIGLWHASADGKTSAVLPGAEVQCLSVENDGIWVGTRTGILWLAGQPVSPP